MDGGKWKYWRTVTLFTLLLLFISFYIVGCTSKQDTYQIGRDIDLEFDKGSGIYLTSITEKNIMDLAKLCKVWGVVKYYHPEIISGNINWDYELFRIMPSFLEQDSDVNSILYNWVHSLGGNLNFDKTDGQYKYSEDIIQLNPSTDWCKDENYLGKDLSL